MASEVIMLADLLLRILDRIESRRTAEQQEGGFSAPRT